MLKGKDASLGNFMLNHPGHVTLSSWIFQKVLPVLGNIEMIWASNSKRFRVYGIFKKWQIDDDKFPELVKNDENDENDKFPELFIDGITLEKETVTKFLGVVID